MLKKQLLIAGLAMSLAFTPTFSTLAAENTTTNSTTMETAAHIFLNGVLLIVETGIIL